MKRLLFLLILLSQIAYSQSANDALLISQNSIYGSARMTAMGGAFTALGGDLSAMQLNPASGSVFLESQASLSYGFSNIKNSSSFYNGGGEGEVNYNYINQLGVVFVLENPDAYSSIVKYALGFNYNRTNNYNENISFKGNNNTELNVYNGNDLMYSGFSSIATSFILSANGYLPYNKDNPYETQVLSPVEQMAFDMYLLDMNTPNDPNNPDEGSIYYDPRYPTFTAQDPVYVMSAIANNTLQDYNMSRTGYSGQYNFSGSMDINNKLYFGFSYDRSIFNMQTNIKLKESQFATNSEVQELIYESETSTYGTGNGFSVGAIYKATDFIRLGASYHSPTWYNMSEEYSYKLSITNKTFANEKAQTEILFSDYEITTPSKFDAGIAFIFGKNGLISADYQYVNYSAMSIGPDNYFSYENEEIKNTMTSTHNVRVGTEWKVSFVSLRAGYNYSQSPYKNKGWQSDTDSYSFGAGINFRTWKLDLAYQTSTRNYDYYIYETDLVEASNINKFENNIVATLRFNL